MKNPKAAVSLLTRKIFAPIIRLLSRRKTAENKDLDNASNSEVGNIDNPQYFYPHELKSVMHRLDNTLEQVHLDFEKVRLLVTEGIEIMNNPGKVKLNDFIVAMRFRMSTRLYYRLSSYSDDCRSACLDDLDEETFLNMRGVGKATYTEFLSVKEEYYKKINRNSK